jgi:hypothetical protein
MTANEIVKIVTDVVEWGRVESGTNEELQNEFEFEAQEQGFGREEIKAAVKSSWFPWFK